MPVNHKIEKRKIKIAIPSAVQKPDCIDFPLNILVNHKHGNHPICQPFVHSLSLSAWICLFSINIHGQTIAIAMLTELVLRQQISSVQIDELPSLYNES